TAGGRGGGGWGGGPGGGGELDGLRQGEREPDADHRLELGVGRAEPIRVLVREWLKQDGIDDAEDRGVGADGEAEREDGDGGEARVFGHRAEPVACVVEDPHAGSRGNRRAMCNWLQLLAILDGGVSVLGRSVPEAVSGCGW